MTWIPVVKDPALPVEIRRAAWHVETALLCVEDAYSASLRLERSEFPDMHLNVIVAYSVASKATFARAAMFLRTPGEGDLLQ